MNDEERRQWIVDMVKKMQLNTIDRGCTPGEAANFAAKCAELIERYQITQMELEDRAPTSEDIEVCQNILRTGKKVHNPGMTAVICGLSQGMCCKVIQLHENGEACYGIVGEQTDSDYVCQMSLMLVPALKEMADAEGREHGREKAGLIRWANQYLTGAGTEIMKRLQRERKQRSQEKEAEHKIHGTAMICITGDMVATAKLAAVEDVFKSLYPQTKPVKTSSQYDHTADQCGRQAGRRIGLHSHIGQQTTPKLS